MELNKKDFALKWHQNRDDDRVNDQYFDKFFKKKHGFELHNFENFHYLK